MDDELYKVVNLGRKDAAILIDVMEYQHSKHDNISKDSSGLYIAAVLSSLIGSYYCSFRKEAGAEWADQWLDAVLLEITVLAKQWADVDMHIVNLRRDKE